MKVYKKGNKIIFEVPFWSKRVNPYMLGEDVGKHHTLMGLICYDKCGNEEMGFVQVIDMDYKDKSDQWTDFVIHIWDRDEKEFVQLCNSLGIDCVDARDIEDVKEECRDWVNRNNT